MTCSLSSTKRFALAILVLFCTSTVSCAKSPARTANQENQLKPSPTGNSDEYRRASLSESNQYLQLGSVPASQEPRIRRAKAGEQPSIADLASGRVKPPRPEEMQGQFKEGAKDWFYGSGLGKTATNVGLIVVFPPYAIYLVGNALLDVAGLPTLYASDALPEPVREKSLYLYEQTMSVPGRFNAAVAGEEFRGLDAPAKTDYGSNKDEVSVKEEYLQNENF